MIEQKIMVITNVTSETNDQEVLNNRTLNNFLKKGWIIKDQKTTFDENMGEFAITILLEREKICNQ